ncbi:CAP domain-containing protein [Patescibacteria group bacterium]|nr:CAP domain-containing protein [Patescibacteria group bacterium]
MAGKKILIILLVVLAFASFLFKDQIFNLYYSFHSNLAEFQKFDFYPLLEKIKQDISISSPLFLPNSSKGSSLASQRIIEETNKQRALFGLPPVSENAQLDEAALAKAEDMFKKQYFDHVSPSGLDPGTLVLNHGYDYILTGENLILGNFSSEAELVQNWMDSPGHRANILNERYSEIGVSAVSGTYQGEKVWISVQEFGLPLSFCPIPSLSLKQMIEYNQDKLDQIALLVDQLYSKARQGSGVEEYNQLVSQYNNLSRETEQLVRAYNSQAEEFNRCLAR